MSTILVTGGAGFIGSHVAEGLVQRGHQVTVLDGLSARCTCVNLINAATFLR